MDVNIVPLVDVLMVLIFFFMMTMQFREERVLNINLPEIETAGENRVTEILAIAVDASGGLFLNNQPVDEAALATALELQGTLQRNRPVLIVADEEAALKRVTRIIDLCREAGLENFRLQSR